MLRPIWSHPECPTKEDIRDELRRSDVALVRFIKPILAIEDDDVCFELLEPFVDPFACRQIHDAETLSVDILENFRVIADRVGAADWRWDAGRVNGNLTRQKHA